MRWLVVGRMVSYILFPVTFTGALWMALEGLDRGAPTELLLAGISAAVMLIVAIFERVHPEHPEWNVSQDDVRTDLMHGLVSMVLLPQALELGLRLGLLHVALWLSSVTGGSLWPDHWSPLLQLIPALLISQLGEYWAHRAMHEVPFMWRFHATHHSPGRLYWLNAGRFHPVDSALLFSIALTPLLLLGAGPEVLLLFTVWVSVHGTFQHCNIRLRLGPLNYVFSMAELHRWHHSRVLEEANANYGNNILFWDLVFGTVHYPKDRSASPHIGLSDLPGFPRGYLEQLLSPWRMSRYHDTSAGEGEEQ